MLRVNNPFSFQFLLDKKNALKGYTFYYIYGNVILDISRDNIYGLCMFVCMYMSMILQYQKLREDIKENKIPVTDKGLWTFQKLYKIQAENTGLKTQNPLLLYSHKQDRTS